MISDNVVLCSDLQRDEFVAWLKSAQLDLCDSEDGCELVLGNTVIADLVEPRFINFSNAYRSCFVECSLDFGDGMNPEDSFEAEIPKMKVRIYKAVLRNGQIMRDVPERTDEDLVDELIEGAYSDEPSEGEVIVRMSELNYKVCRV